MPPPPVAQLDVSTAVGVPPLRRFVGRLALTFDTGAAGDRPRFDPASSRFDATFHALEYNALDPPGGGFAGSVVGEGTNRVRVILDAARRVVRLRTTADAGSTLDLYRVDGTTFAVEPTTQTETRTTPIHTYTVPGAFVDATFGVEGASTPSLADVMVRSEPAGVSVAVVPASTSDTAAAAVVPAWRSSDVAPSGVDLGAAFAAALQSVVDDQLEPLPTPLALSLVITADAPLHVVVRALAVPHLLVDTGFAALPLVPSDVADPVALVTALRIPRSAPVAELRGRVLAPTRVALDAATDRSPALVARLLQDLSASLATTPLWDADRFSQVDVPPHLAAVAGDAVVGERLVRVNRALVEVSLPGIVRPRTDDRVLDLAEEPSVAVRRPPGGPVVSATLVAMPDPDVGRTVGGAGDTGVAPDPVGADILAGGWIAALLRPAHAITATGIEVLLLGVEVDTTVTVEVIEDHGGLPAGRQLATGRAAVPAGRTGWVRLDLDSRVVLGTRDHWIALRAAAGRAVWLASPDDAARWARRGDQDWTAWSTTGLGARFRLVTAVVGGSEPALVMPVDGVDLPSVGDDPTRRDLSAVLGPGPTTQAQVVVVAPRGTGTTRLAAPEVVYEP